MNECRITGKLATHLVFSHELKKERYFEGILDCTRISGTMDQIRILIPASVLEGHMITQGDGICIEGRLQTLYTPEGEILHSNLVCEVLKLEKTDSPEMEENCVFLEGTIWKKRPIKTTPKGRILKEFVLRTQDEDGIPCVVPCLAWGTENADAIEQAPMGTSVKLAGRLQSRVFPRRLNDGTREYRMVHEVSCSSLEAAEVKKTSQTEVF